MFKALSHSEGQGQGCLTERDRIKTLSHSEGQEQSSVSLKDT